MALSIIVYGVICQNSNFSFDPSYDGWNRLFDYFKFPLSLAALSLPLTGLFAAHHRSSQMAETLKEASTQNVITKYYSHKKDFFELLEKIESEKEIKFKYNSLYRALFPHNDIKKVSPVFSPTSTGHETQPDLLTDLTNYFIGVNADYEDIIRNINLRKLSKEGGVTIPGVGEEEIRHAISEYYKKITQASNQLLFTIVTEGDTTTICKTKILFSKSNPNAQLYLINEIIEELVRFCDVEETAGALGYVSPHEEFSGMANSTIGRNEQTYKHLVKNLIKDP
ncbi:hypothetical protein [Microbulbifer sp. JMSA002]|uniref:hypothetical protein n=1 Tax=Microbulbifer sp. JMSA002 TaxID=3243368 RepID=UPI00403A3462